VRSCLEYRAAMGVISAALKGLPLLTLVLLLHGLVPADTPLFPPETGLIDQQHRDWRCYSCGMTVDLNLNCRHSALNSREALHLDRVGIHVIIFAQHRVSGSSGQVRTLISRSGHPLFSVVKFPFDHSGPALFKRNDDVLEWGAVLSSQEGFPPIWMSPFDVQEGPNESGHDVGFGYLGKFHHGIAAGGCLFKRLPDIETASGPTVEARNRYGKLPVGSDLASKRGRNARVIFIEQAVGGHNRPIIRAANRDHRGSVLHYCWAEKTIPSTYAEMIGVQGHFIRRERILLKMFLGKILTSVGTARNGSTCSAPSVSNTKSLWIRYVRHSGYGRSAFFQTQRTTLYGQSNANEPMNTAETVIRAKG
jgi:hypothetical protein